jgi:hypothetical protein
VSSHRPSRFYRSGYYPAMFYAIAVMGLGVAVFILIVAPFSLSLLPVVGGLLAIAAFQLRGPRLGAHVSDQSVALVRNFRTIKVPINDVARVVVRPHPPALKAGHLERKDGSLIWIQGLAPSRAFQRNSPAFDALIVELNADIDSRKSN